MWSSFQGLSSSVGMAGWEVLKPFVGLGLVGVVDNIKKNRRTLVLSFKIRGLIENNQLTFLKSTNITFLSNQSSVISDCNSPC